MYLYLTKCNEMTRTGRNKLNRIYSLMSIRLLYITQSQGKPYEGYQINRNICLAKSLLDGASVLGGKQFCAVLLKNYLRVCFGLCLNFNEDVLNVVSFPFLSIRKTHVK